MMIYKARIIKIFLVFIIAVSAVSAKALKKDSVNIYVQVQDVWDLDYNKSTVMVDFYLMMEGYANDTSKTIYLLNGEVLSCDTINDDTTLKYFALQIKALIKTDFNFTRFPLDGQRIILKFEPYMYANSITFYSKADQNIYVDTVHLKGWDAEEINFQNKPITYRLKEKDGFKEYKYNDVYFTIPITRQNGFFNLMKAFLPSLIALIIIYIGFFVPNTQLESRFNISLGSLFVVISNFIVIQQYLPEIANLTLIEKLNLITLIIIVLTIFYFALSNLKRNEKKVIKRIRTVYVITTLLLYVLLIYVFIV
jgi:hypothetical protein